VLIMVHVVLWKHFVKKGLEAEKRESSQGESWFIGFVLLTWCYFCVESATNSHTLLPLCPREMGIGSVEEIITIGAH